MVVVPKLLGIVMTNNIQEKLLRHARALKQPFRGARVVQKGREVTAPSSQHFWRGSIRREDEERNVASELCSR
jgi:hypothetical protein